MEKENLEDLTNNEILFKIKQYESDYESLRAKMLNDFDKMLEIEKLYENANQILIKRLKAE